MYMYELLYFVFVYVCWYMIDVIIWNVKVVLWGFGMD